MELAETLFYFFQGWWLIDRSTNGQGKMQGEASFSLRENDFQTLLYREEGEHITQKGCSLSFFKEYLYCLNDQKLEVHFTRSGEKGELFYQLLLLNSGTLATASHLCGQDMYAATYQFLDRNHFTLQYDIHGPKKDIRLHTLFTRQVGKLAF